MWKNDSPPKRPKFSDPLLFFGRAQVSVAYSQDTQSSGTDTPRKCPRTGKKRGWAQFAEPFRTEKKGLAYLSAFFFLSKLCTTLLLVYAYIPHSYYLKTSGKGVSPNSPWFSHRMANEAREEAGRFLANSSFFFGHVIEWTDETREAREECCYISTGERKKPRTLGCGLRAAADNTANSQVFGH